MRGPHEAVARPRPKCGHSPGHEAGSCVPALDSHAAAHLDDWLSLRDHREVV